MKLTKQQLKQIIREEVQYILNEVSSDWTVEKWTELLNNILQQKDLTLTHEASPRNVAGVADYLVKNNITPDHFKQSIMGHDYLDRNTLAAAGWPLQGGGDRDVATVVAGILMGPK